MEPALPLHALARFTPQGRELIQQIELSQAMCSLGLALSYRDLGQSEKVQKALTDARARLAVLEKLDPREGQEYMVPWLIRFSIEIIHRELAAFEQ